MCVANLLEAKPLLISSDLQYLRCPLEAGSVVYIYHL